VNLILLEPHELTADATASLTGRRARHAFETLRAKPGDELVVGVRNGDCGLGRVIACSPDTLTMSVRFERPPPPRLNVSLILALPRPKALRRILATVASLGVDRLALINAFRVEKSFFDADVLNEAEIQTQFDGGLEQAKDTVAPAVTVYKRFRPFVEDVLPTWAQAASVRMLPHPTAQPFVARIERTQSVTVAIGPEGGWIPFEIEMLQRLGFETVSFGPRVLRTEVAVPAILGAIRGGF
jgi:RsmE family RNA methyltransferase